MIEYKRIEELFTKEEIQKIRHFIPQRLVYSERENDSASYADDIIIGRYSSREIALLCICHEYGHFKHNEERRLHDIYAICTLSNESLAWHYGLIVARKIEEYIDGLNFDFDKYSGHDMKFIRKCLKSYYGGEYDELKGEE